MSEHDRCYEENKARHKRESGRRCYFFPSAQERQEIEMMFEHFPPERRIRSQYDVRRTVSLLEGAAKALRKMLVPRVQMKTRKPVGQRNDQEGEWLEMVSGMLRSKVASLLQLTLQHIENPSSMWFLAPYEFSCKTIL